MMLLTSRLDRGYPVSLTEAHLVGYPNQRQRRFAPR